MSAAAPLDPHDKMRGRDVNKVARGEQAPRPVHEPGTVSAPPPRSSTDSKLDAGKEASANAIGERIGHCYIQFLEYKRNQDPSAPVNCALLQLSSETKDLMNFKDGSPGSDFSGVLNNEDCSFHYPLLLPPKSHQSGEKTTGLDVFSNGEGDWTGRMEKTKTQTIH
nr:putative cytochrome C oxidase subunit 6B-like [Ipomoea batatas]